MAIADIVKKKIGRELREWIFLGIRTGARRGVENYRSLIVIGRDTEAVLAIKRAIDLPHRVRERIDYFIDQYSQSFLFECMAFEGTTTLAELNSELQILENYAQNLVNRQGGGESWDDLASDIETNIEKESTKWIFPLPPGYTDIWDE